jgi:mono/diheme cytochrome c family protein
MNRFGARTGLRRVWLLGATAALGLVLAGCGDFVPSTNTYPIDFFSEMHYSKAWGHGEPDGWNPPAGAVPITGGEVDYEMDEAADIENPFDANAELGAEVYRLNCVQCHGPDAEGDGIMAEIYFPAYEADVPPNLREATGDRADGEIFWIVTNGLGEYMPAFRMLLTEEERWALVDHLREIEK